MKYRSSIIAVSILILFSGWVVNAQPTPSVHFSDTPSWVIDQSFDKSGMEEAKSCFHLCYFIQTHIELGLE